MPKIISDVAADVVLPSGYTITQARVFREFFLPSKIKSNISSNLSQRQESNSFIFSQRNSG